MSQDTPSLESALQELDAAALDESFLTRLEACALDTWTTLTPEETRLEEQLRSIAPDKLPDALIDSLEATVKSIPFPGNDEKIVHFPNTKKPPRHRSRNTWWSAAAVALIGAMTAVFIPHDQEAPKTADSQPAPIIKTAPAGGRLVPATFNRRLKETHDEGVIWQAHDQPKQVLKVTYIDRTTLKDEHGRIHQIEQPRVEYYVIPAKTD